MRFQAAFWMLTVVLLFSACEKTPLRPVRCGGTDPIPTAALDFPAVDLPEDAVFLSDPTDDEIRIYEAADGACEITLLCLHGYTWETALIRLTGRPASDLALLKRPRGSYTEYRFSWTAMEEDEVRYTCVMAVCGANVSAVTVAAAPSPSEAVKRIRRQTLASFAPSIKPFTFSDD